MGGTKRFFHKDTHNRSLSQIEIAVLTLQRQRFSINDKDLDVEENRPRPQIKTSYAKRPQLHPQAFLSSSSNLSRDPQQHSPSSLPGTQVHCCSISNFSDQPKLKQATSSFSFLIATRDNDVASPRHSPLLAPAHLSHKTKRGDLIISNPFAVVTHCMCQGVGQHNTPKAPKSYLLPTNLR